MDNLSSSLSRSFSQYCASSGVEVPNDFIELAVKAMVHLKENHHSNVVYNLAKGLGVMCLDKSDTRFPMKVMPMGLLEYMVNFFNAEEMRKVSRNVPWVLLFFNNSCLYRFLIAQKTINFGRRLCTFSSDKKWSKLHHGPMWSGVDGEKMDTMEVHLHVCYVISFICNKIIGSYKHPWFVRTHN